VKTFGAELNKRIATKGVAVQALAKRIGKSPSYISESSTPQSGAIVSRHRPGIVPSTNAGSAMDRGESNAADNNRSAIKHVDSRVVLICAWNVRTGTEDSARAKPSPEQS